MNSLPSSSVAVARMSVAFWIFATGTIDDVGRLGPLLDPVVVEPELELLRDAARHGLHGDLDLDHVARRLLLRELEEADGEPGVLLVDRPRVRVDEVALRVEAERLERLLLRDLPEVELDRRRARGS